MLKRILAVLATATLAVGLALGAAMPASAHVPTVTPACGSLTVKLASYPGTNTVTVTIDGVAEPAATFQNNFTKSYPWSTTASHTYKVEINAADNYYDKLGANAITGTFGPCATPEGCVNAMTALKGFTVLTSGNATVGSSGEFEGSLAVGGDLSYGQYNLNAHKDGSSLPAVDGDDIQLFVGGTVNISSGKFDVNAGWTRITNTSGLLIKDSVRLSKSGASGYVLTQGGGRQQTTISGSAQNSYTATPGAFAAAFPAATFTDLAADSAALAALTAGPDVALVTANAASPERTITLTSGKINVWNVSASTLAGLTAVNFAGDVKPSATTPLILNVTDDAGGTVKAVRLNIGDVNLSKYILWNFSGWPTLTVQNGGSFNGSILAPAADLSYQNNSEFNGQIAAKTFAITTSAEIHHYAYLPCATVPTDVSGAATAAPETCDTAVYLVKDGSVTATAKTGVQYELWNAARTSKIADLVAGTPYAVGDGTYSVKVLPVSASYTVTSANTWIDVSVGAYTGDCSAPQDVSGTANASPEFCDTGVYLVKPGSVLATAATGVTYELWNAAKTSKIADLVAGTPYNIGEGSYAVKVLPASAAYTVSAANTWIPVTVGAYTGDCSAPTDVSGAVTPTAEFCDVDYEVKQGAITATVRTGVVYELWNAAQTVKIADLVAGTPYRIGDGDYAVKVLPASAAYTVSVANTWIPVTVGDYTGLCAEEVTGAATPTAEVCDVDYEITQGAITATVKTGVVYELWNAAKTVKIADLTAGAAYPVDGGTYAVKVLPATSKYTVSEANTWIPVTVGDYTGLCAEEVTGAATAAAEVCDVDDYEVEKGAITATVKTGVVYELWNAAKTVKIADLTAGTAYPVDGGTYAVKVLPATSKYTVSEANTWLAVVVDANRTVCDVIGDPTKFEACVADPTDLLTSDWTAYLTIVAVDHVQYRVYFGDGTTWVDQGVWAAGRHDAGTTKLPYDTLVKVVAEPESGWNLLAPKDWTFDFLPASTCNLDTGGSVEPRVTFAQSCSAGASYTLSIDGGVAGTVLWSVNGGPATTQLGTFSVASPSTVKVVATPAPGSGFPGSGAPVREFERTFAALDDCELETLALTGATTWPALALAGILFQAGLALLAVRVVRSRQGGRHLA